MAFRYINPGYKDLFDTVAANAVQGRDPALAFSRTSGDYFTLGSKSARSYLNIESGDEYWIAFYCVSKYNTNTYNHWMFSAFNSAQGKGVHLFRQGNTNSLGFAGNNDAVIVPAKIALSLNKGYHIEFYLKRGAEGKIVMWVDGQQTIDATVDLSYINLFDKIYFGGEEAEANSTYFSDIIIQNTGRIGDMRVNSVLPKTRSAISEWDKCVLPIGYDVVSQYSNLSVGNTMVLLQHQFTLTGTIHAVRVRPYNANPISFKFCLFRLNPLTGKYNPVEVTGEYQFASEDVQKIVLSKPMVVQAKDYFAFYMSGSSNASLSLASSDKGEYTRFTGDTTAGPNEVTMPTSTYNYKPCIHALFIPDDITAGVNEIARIDAQNPDLVAKYGGFETGSIDKSILYVPDPANMKIGRVDVVSVAAVAHYEGESPAKSLCSVLKSGDQVYNGTPRALVTESKRYNLDALGENPLTNTLWTVSDLQAMEIGIKSKA